jgi:prepilin-type N-terminal cleavage/methylation domain-containing protein
MHHALGQSAAGSHRTSPIRRGVRGGFTLVEVLMIVAIIAILAATVIAEYQSLFGMGKAEAMSVTVAHVRRLVELKTAKHEGPLAPSGFPAAIDPNWFKRNKLPCHTWTDKPMIVETVAAGADQVYPAVKVFDETAPGAKNAWYNTTNGAFCVRVGDTINDARNLKLFNMANSARATTMDQTTE